MDTAAYDFSQGFCVAGDDTAAFLENALSQLGLTRREAGEFIVYWLPQMQDNPYTLIAFQSDAYTRTAQLTVTPEPDTLLRVFMAWTPLERPAELPAQSLTAPARIGFTAVEWGDAGFHRQISDKNRPFGRFRVPFSRNRSENIENRRYFFRKVPKCPCIS